MDKPASPYRRITWWLRRAALALMLGAIPVMLFAAITQIPVRVSIGESEFTLHADKADLSCTYYRNN